MKFIGDFHIHSHYSISTSKKLVPEHLNLWASLKGIKVIGTGDFTHPSWVKELKEKLEPAEQGLFKLKAEYKLKDNLLSEIFKHNEVRFMLTAEISNIYKKQGRVRKVHNVIFAPDFETVEKIQKTIAGMGGNITSDGRPILGLDSKDLLDIALNASDKIFFVPAHIWTPWFSVLGTKSGFDSIEECYEDLTKNIFAVETGLSSDPPMNWLCSFLDKFTLISNSDAHSPEKLGREANLFDTEFSYDAIIDAIKTGVPGKFLGTVEFFPQEGKYHYDGHRKCGIVWDPVQTLKNKEICTKCGKKVTVGVVNRVVQLADRDNITKLKERVPFYSLIPLKEILSEIEGVGPNSKRVRKAYNSILEKGVTEFDILLNLTLKEIKEVSSDVVAEGIRRMRNREVHITEGFDGEYGKIKVFRNKGEVESFSSDSSLFKYLVVQEEKAPYIQKRKLINFDLKEFRRLKESHPISLQRQGKKPKVTKVSKEVSGELNEEQHKAVKHFQGPALVIAGPGTGKTRVLTCRIANLIQNKGIEAENILAVTFTNKAAGEMKSRIEELLKGEKGLRDLLTVLTFHALGYSILKKYHDKVHRKENFTIIDEVDKERILIKEINIDKTECKAISGKITNIKQNLKSPDDLEEQKVGEIFKRYEKRLIKNNLFDLDDLVYLPVKLLNENQEILTGYRKKYVWILVDEYQDINYAQYQMIRKLMPGLNSNLFVIGDPNQAIYGFRGANVIFIKEFKNDYPETKVYELKKSYRCTDSILKASRNILTPIIPPLERGKGKEGMLKGLQKGVKLKIVENATDKSEAEFIARKIENLMGGLRFFSIDSDITTGERHAEINSLSDFVVLCRIRAQFMGLEKAFNDHGIPYQTIGDSSLFTQEPAKSIIDILKLACNPQNEFLKNKLKEKKIIGSLAEPFLNKLTEKISVKGALDKIIEKYFGDAKEEKETLLRKLIDTAEDYKNDFEGFFKLASLGTGVDIYSPELENVTLMTLHSAKGLEFKCVFIVGCEDRLLPYSIFEKQKSDIDEERRLLYVGMTRSKKFLFLTHAKKRFMFGKKYNLQKSRFLEGIEKELTEMEKPEYRKKAKKDDREQTLFDN